MSTCSTRSHFISSPIASGKLRGGLNNRPGFSLVQLSPQACKHSGNSFVQPLHVSSLQVRPENRTRRIRHGVRSTRLLGTFVQGLPRH